MTGERDDAGSGAAALTRQDVEDEKRIRSVEEQQEYLRVNHPERYRPLDPYWDHGVLEALARRGYRLVEAE